MNPQPVTTDERDSLASPPPDFAHLPETLTRYGAPQWMVERASGLAQR